MFERESRSEQFVHANPFSEFELVNETDDRLMPISFKKAPLIELVAELRWPTATGLQIQGSAGGIQVSFGATASSDEEFFNRFGTRILAAGFSASERVVPTGFPLVPYQVAYRYRRPNEIKELLQVGPGVFTANALRPYQAWHIFRPSVKAGVEALLDSRVVGDAASPFLSVALRYINAFTNELIGNASVAEVLRETFGIDVVVPDAIGRHVRRGTVPSPSMRLAFDTESRQSVIMNIGDGMVADSRGLVLDTTVTAGATGGEAQPIAANVEAIMAALDQARDVQHDMFLRLTERIRTQMGPEGND